LFFSQTTDPFTPACTRPCYDPNTRPCKLDTDVCLKSDNTKVGCEYLCINRSSTDEQVKLAFSYCGSPCDQNTYKCSTDEKCTYKKESGCYQCEPVCTGVNCFAQPCSVISTRQKECLTKVAPDFVCVDNYCNGCTAEFYSGGVRVCSQVPDACPKCDDTCLDSQRRKVDPQTGCDVCGSCQPICPLYACAYRDCPYGFATDDKGCPTCGCNQCPPESYCKMYCPNGYTYDPITKCRNCECAPEICPAVRCAMYCEFGYVLDAKGCQTCECKKCDQPVCPTIKCSRGYYTDVNGCPICKCLPDCLNYCPFGYDFSAKPIDATASASSGIVNTDCRCNCPVPLCFKACDNGYVYDKFGCQTCECVIKYDQCPEVKCDLACKVYAVDANGCRKCECAQPQICPAIACVADSICAYGTSRDASGCPECNKCEPCPLVKCDRYCQYGFQYDPKTGCQTCLCNEKPFCPLGVDAAAVCNLKCDKGIVYDNGCPTCRCNEVEPCSCTVKPTTEARLCPDGVTQTRYTDVCQRDANNVCSFVQTKCPYGITITVKGTLTEADLAAIKAKAGVTNPDDLRVEKIDNGDGTTTYKFWFAQEGVESGKTASDVSKDVTDGSKERDPNAVAYVISDGTVNPKSFANILVPVLGFFFLMLLF